MDYSAQNILDLCRGFFLQKRAIPRGRCASDSARPEKNEGTIHRSKSCVARQWLAQKKAPGYAVVMDLPSIVLTN